MENYNLAGLDPRTFQQMIQALAIPAFGPGVVVYGDGPDGARDASFSGRSNYPSANDPWDGDVIIQVKYRTKPTFDSNKDGQWVCNELNKELKKFGQARKQKKTTTATKTHLKPPDYYLFVTNIELTPCPKTGSDVKARAVLKRHQRRLRLDSCDIWDGNKIARLLDNGPDIAREYASYVSSGNVLSKMHSYLKNLTPDFEQVMRDFLQAEFCGQDQYARLSEAGSAKGQKIPLATVFIDLPFAANPSSTPPEEKKRHSRALPPGFVEQVLNLGNLHFDRTSVLDRSVNPSPASLLDVAAKKQATPEEGRIVLIGGPGQGKSTISQFICQLYRAAILKDVPRTHLSPQVSLALDQFIQTCQKDAVALPSARRLPIRVELKKFADALAAPHNQPDHCPSLLHFIAKKINKASARTVKPDDVETWLGSCAWLLLLDGLDEVPATGNRDRILAELAMFEHQCATRGADVLAIATSRPQGYAGAFDPRLYCHQYLLPLSLPHALHYAKRLGESSHPDDPDLRNDILRRLQIAAKNPTSERLMQSPLQVTILSVLAELRGELPRDRWQLFDQYYTTILNRETQRNQAFSHILRDYAVEIGRIHQATGLRLQIANETSGTNDAVLKKEEFLNLVTCSISEKLESEATIAATANDITTAALDRLVFLVSPREDDIGFEIRSLQEFMAAKALLDGPEDLISQRLRAIAPIPFWRNVFLFAAGYCASQRLHFIDTIIGLCTTINNDDDPILNVTLEGSQLALDLLEDETFRYPKHTRSLAEIALKLLDLPDEVSWKRVAQVLLSQACLSDVCRQKVRQILQNEPLSASGWTVVFTAIQRGEGWATDMADEFLPSDVNDQFNLIWDRCNRKLDWAQERLSCIEAGLSILNFFPRLRYGEEIHPLPPLINAAAAVLWPFIAEKNERQDCCLALLDNHARITINSVTEPYRELFFPISKEWGVRDRNGPWAPLLALVNFCHNPTTTTLRDTLSQIMASSLGVYEIQRLATRAPWPLGCFLYVVSKQPALAGSVDEWVDSFGDHQQWLDLETKWSTECISESEVRHALCSPKFDIESAWSAYLHSIIVSSQHLQNMWAFFCDVFRSSRSQIGRAICADALLNIGVAHLSAQNHLSTIDAPTLGEICDFLSTWDMPRLLCVIAFPAELDHAWTRVLDSIGRRCPYLPLHGFPQASADAVIKALKNNPDALGLYNFAAALAQRGLRLEAPPSLVLNPDDAESVWLQKLALRLHFGLVDPNDVENLALHASTKTLSDEWNWGIEFYLPDILMPWKGAPWADRFVAALFKNLQYRRRQSPWMCYRWLRECVVERRSLLHEPTVVKDLGLGKVLS